MSAIKLKKTLDLKKFSLDKKFISYGKEINGEFQGLEYWTLFLENSSEILNIISEQYINDFSLSFLRINTSYVPPHTDSNILSTINFYIETEECTTTFFEFKNKNPVRHQLENQTTGYLFNESDLIESQKFVAKPNEIWLLDVSKPHSVVSSKSNFKERKAICLQSRVHNFNRVIEMLKETNIL
jgi:hypothetical protein